MKNFTRRKLFKSMAGAGAALPMLPFLNSPAFAQTGNGGGPMRLLLLGTGYGGHWEYLRPRQPGETLHYDPVPARDVAITQQSLDFEHSILAPLTSYADKMTVLEGISFHNALIDNTLYSGHERSPTNIFTGSVPKNVNGEEFPQSASLEYLLGQEIGGSNVARSLSLGIGCLAGADQYSAISFDNFGNRLPVVHSAQDLFNYLLGGASPGGSSVDSDLVGKQAVLNALESSAQRLRARLQGREEQKLDQHLSALADLESQLQSQMVPMSCEESSAPANDPAANGAAMNNHTTAMFEVIAQAFMCDRTRFVNAAWGHNAGNYGSWFLPQVTDWHGQVGHTVGFIDAGQDQATQQGILNANLALAELQRWYANSLKAFMDRLDSIPEGDGTVLDNTLIVWAQDFGPNTHSGLNVPYVLLGGGAEKFRMGRSISYYASQDTSWWASVQPQNCSPNNKLFNSIAQGFGIEEDNFGGVSGTLNGINS